VSPWHTLIAIDDALRACEEFDRIKGKLAQAMAFYEQLQGELDDLLLVLRVREQHPGPPQSSSEDEQTTPPGFPSFSFGNSETTRVDTDAAQEGRSTVTEDNNVEFGNRPPNRPVLSLHGAVVDQTSSDFEVVNPNFISSAPDVYSDAPEDMPRPIIAPHNYMDDEPDRLDSSGEVISASHDESLKSSTPTNEDDGFETYNPFQHFVKSLNDQLARFVLLFLNILIRFHFVEAKKIFLLLCSIHKNLLSYPKTLTMLLSLQPFPKEP
jgi:hypothetical protein